MVKHKRVLAISLLCIVLASTTVVGALALSRLYMAYNYAAQYAGMAKVGVESSTNLTLLIYSDPEPARWVFDLFQLVTAENIEWKGATMDPQGNAIKVDVKLGSVSFEKLNGGNYVGTVKEGHVNVVIGDLISILVQADELDVNVKYWTYMDMPALNVTEVLTGNVVVRLSVAVLPFPGLALAVYEYKGDQFIISICAIKPIDVTIIKPLDGETVSGDVKIQASVKAVPELSVENVRWWTRGEGGYFEGDMSFNESSGLWEAVWPSYYVGNGGYELAVRAEGVDRDGVEFRYPDEDRIKVEVYNPPFEAHAYFETRDKEISVNMEWWYHEKHGWNFTPFTLERRVGYVLMAPGGWATPPYGAMHFERWIIRDDAGNVIFEHRDLRIEVNQEILGMLWNRQLECIYVPG